MSDSTTGATVVQDDSSVTTSEVIGVESNAAVVDPQSKLSFQRRFSRQIMNTWKQRNLSAAVAATCLAAWMILFVAGSFVNASELIGSALDAPEFSFIIGVRFLAGVASWTWTNLLMLCVLSAFLGGVARFWGEDLDYRAVQFDALTTGFVVFMLFMFEESVMGGRLNTAANPDAQGTYMRLVIVSSLLSFVASYRPDFLQGLLSHFADSQSSAANSSSSAKRMPR